MAFVLKDYQDCSSDAYHKQEGPSYRVVLCTREEYTNGIDSRLVGDKFVPEHQDNTCRGPRSIVILSRAWRLKLGYWRKHWALHNYIEANYNDGESLGKVELGPISLREIADAVEQGKVPDADYRGEIDAYHKEPDQVAATVKTLRDAADWLEKDDNTWKSVEYYGSW